MIDPLVDGSRRSGSKLASRSLQRTKVYPFIILSPPQPAIVMNEMKPRAVTHAIIASPN
jgi:hypothetical protein